MNVASVFGGEETEEDEDQPEQGETREGSRSEGFDAQPRQADASPVEAAAGTVAEEEIDEEEEADLVSYVEDLEEDAAFDDLEEETHSAGDYTEPGDEHEIAASAENHEGAFPSDLGSEEAVGIAEAEGVDEESARRPNWKRRRPRLRRCLILKDARTVPSMLAPRSGHPPQPQPIHSAQAAPAHDRDRGGRSGRRVRSGGGGQRRFRRREPQNLPQITDLLKEGQEILVQIAKEPIGKKGARITSHIALPGRFLVYMPTVNLTGISRKITSEEERQRLKRIIISERENGHGGFIVRTAAQGADEQELRADIRFLKGLWNEIRGRAENSKPPALIYHDLNVVERVLRDQVTSDFAAIWVDNEQEYERILRFADVQPALVRRVKLYTKDTPLFEQFGLKEEIDKALKSKVWLKSGGYIVINQTEALVAIDVNTGKYVGKTARLEARSSKPT